MAKVQPSIDLSSSLLSPDDLRIAAEPLQEASAYYRSVERRRPKQSSFNLIYISDPWRVRWDIAIILLALYNCVLIPYRIAFAQGFEQIGVLNIIDLVIDLLFILDIYLNFRTSYIDLKTGEEVTKKRKIAKNYVLHGRFFVDLLASIPVDLLLLIMKQTTFIALAKLLKLTRILRLGRIIQYLRLQEDFKLPLRIAKLILSVFIYLHLLACAWKVVVTAEKEWVPPPDTIRVDSDRLYDESRQYQYVACLYSAVSMLVGIELLPVDNTTYVFCSVSIIAGAMLTTYMFGEIAVLVFSLNRKVSSFFSTIDSISTTMTKLKLEASLQFQIADYVKNNYHLLIRNEEWENFQRILPPSFIKQINEFMYHDLVSNHAVFADKPRSIQLVVAGLQYKFARPSDLVIAMGDASTEFYFIVRGSFEVWVEGLDHFDHLAATLESGQFCGEISSLYGVKRTASVKAVAYSTVGILSREDFAFILGENEGLERALKEHITQYTDPYRVEVTVNPT